MLQSLNPAFKPYVLRAMHDWCSDQGFEPYLVVAVDDSCKVPQSYVKNNEIVLNIDTPATGSLSMDDDAVSFQARFSGVVHNLYVPMHRVRGVFPSHAPNLGVWFEVTEVPESSSAEDTQDTADKPRFTLMK